MGIEADGQHGRQHQGDCRPRRGEEGSGVHGGARLHLQVRVWRCGSAASKRHSRARGEDGKGGEDGEEGDEWKASRGERRGLEDREQREDGGLVVPADDHVPCLLLGRDRMLPFHLGGHLALVHATCPRNLHGRSIDTTMAGWMDPTERTTAGGDDGPLHRAVAECPRSRPAPFLRPAPVGRQLTFDSSTTSPHVQCSALARPACRPPTSPTRPLQHRPPTRNSASRGQGG